MKNDSLFQIPVHYVAKILLIILLIIFGCYFYNGLIHIVAYSEDYNMPIAERMLTGDLFLVNADNGPYSYFPGASHVFLAGFIAFGIPVNLIGLLSWVILFIVCKKLGDRFGLDNSMSIVFAASICTTMTVIRTIGDQSIDKWLCAWFVLGMILLEKPKYTWQFSMFLGFALGMLIGTKYSGPLFFLALIPVYWKAMLGYLRPLQFLSFMSTFTITGLFWYIRNFLVEGNPYYPANFLMFRGWPNFTQQDWMLWKIPFTYPEALLPLANAFLSEYIIWALSGFLIIWYLLYSYRKKQPIDDKSKRIIVLIVTTGLVSLLLPITPAFKINLFQIISDMRYVLIFVVLLMLQVFIIADKFKRNSLLAVVAIINAIPPFTYIPYLPKVYIVVVLLLLVIYATRANSIFAKIYSF